MPIKVWNGYNLSRVYIFYFIKTQKLWVTLGDFVNKKAVLSIELTKLFYATHNLKMLLN